MTFAGALTPTRTRVVTNPRPLLPGGRVFVRRGPRSLLESAEFTGSTGGSYRVADETLEGYELYHATGSTPIDYDAAPFESFASLPHETGTLAANTVHRFVLRFRNRYDLLSQNLSEWRLELDGDGDQVSVRPSDPVGAFAQAIADGEVLIGAHYTPASDGSAAADTWLVYLRSNGTDPVPGVDTPTEVAMRSNDGVAKLRHIAGPFSEGADVRAIVRTRRQGTPDVDSTSTTVVSAIATLLGPDAPTAGIYWGDDAEQHQ